MNTSLSGRLPMLEKACSGALRAFEQFAVLQAYPAGTMLAYEGDNCPNFFIVLSGRIRVYKIGENGREITLYYVRPNESCVLTAFCILSRTNIPAFAVAEEDLEIVAAPSIEFRNWIDKFAVWREYTFQNLSHKLNEILNTIEKITFQRVDVRVASYLLNSLPGNGNTVAITHEKLARELGTSRVVVSRILEEFKREGVLRQGRGKITVSNIEALRRLTRKTLPG